MANFLRFLNTAQKHIDNVLDIKDDEEFDGEETKMVKSKTLPSIQQEVKKDTKESFKDVWGSFNGSFFDHKTSLPITNPPPRKSETSSESLEVISKTSSSLASPDQFDIGSSSTLLGSGEESVEVINKTPSVIDLSSSIQPEMLTTSISEESSSILLTPDEVPSIPQASLKTQDDSIVISTSTLTNSETESFYDASKEDVDSTLKTTANIMEKSMESFEIQTQISSSTHSFEEIKMMKKEGGNKQESKAGSGHTSGDELETATSSDIEIISSPNCDSSSTASCNKPQCPRKSSENSPFPYKNSDSFLVDLKLDHKGHSRELSEVSVISLTSDGSSSPSSETEKLLKRISELSEVLEQREYKLVQIGRNNAELTEINSKLTHELESIKKGRTSLDIQEEYTQRLQALEKKFQQSIRDNAQLRKQVEGLKNEMETKISLDDHEKTMTEKDSVIETLKTEGEKLSKQILQHSTNIKKLRAKLKENDELIKRNEAQINELTDENQKIKKTLSAKDEIEKSQNDGKISKHTSAAKIILNYYFRH